MAQRAVALERFLFIRKPMVRDLRGRLVAWPLAISLACADDRIARSEGTAPNGEGSSGATSLLPEDGSADPGLAGAGEPGPVVDDDGIPVHDGTPSDNGEAPEDPMTPPGDADVGAPDAGATSDDGGPLCAPGQPRRAILQWSNVRRFSREAPNTFQVVLFETGDFAYVYRGVDIGSDVPTIGYQGPGGDRAFSLEGLPRPPTREHVVYFRMHPSGVPVVDERAELRWFDTDLSGHSLSLVDEQTERVALPFSFPFLGQSYREVDVSSNGFLGLSPPFAAYTNTALPDASWGAMLAVFWDDLDPGSAGRVTYQAFDDCAPDCWGELGGLARIDRCGVCAGGKTGLVPDADRDCAGVCFGRSVVDACGTCGGTRADSEACGSLPDLVLDAEYMAETLAEDFVDVTRDACLFEEGCVTGTGRRRVVRFGTRIGNIGTRDLVLGAPAAGNPLWEFDACHGHYHFESHAQYDLIDAATSQILPIGVKNGFCLRDNEAWDTAVTKGTCGAYDCGSQGISVGCADVYDADLDCQWVDITDVSPGDYTLRVTTNPNGQLSELDYTNNSAAVRIRIRETEVSALP